MNNLLRSFLSSFATVLLALALPCVVSAQDRLEVGLLGGAAYYLGELNPHSQFKNAGPSAGILARYIFTDRIASRATFAYNRISGHYSSSSSDVYAVANVSQDMVPASSLSDGQTMQVGPADASFSNDVFNLDLLAEVNFLSFDHMFRKEQTRFTPYLALGLGCTSYKRYDDNDDKKRVFVLSLPFGAGVKFKASKFMRVGLEWTFHKLFVDDIDQLDQRDGGHFDPADPYNNGVHVLTHNNDWISALNLTLSFSMWPRSMTCNDGLRSFYRD